MVRIQRAYTMPPNDVQKIVHRMAVNMKNKYELGAEWKSSTHLEFKGEGPSTGVSGDIIIYTDPKLIMIKVQLPFMLIGLRTTIEKEITKTLDEEVY